MSVRVYEKHVEGEPPEIAVDKRTLPHKVPTYFKHLRFSKKLPVNCNDCPHRPKDMGGNGICTVFKADSLCIIRSDIRRQTEKYHTREEGGLLPLLEEELDSQVERLKTFGVLENMANALNPEVSKRLNSVTQLSKVINELKTKETTVSLSEKKVLSPQEKDEINAEVERMMSVTTKTGGL